MGTITKKKFLTKSRLQKSFFCKKRYYTATLLWWEKVLVNAIIYEMCIWYLIQTCNVSSRQFYQKMFD